jgi:hypothetical protein
MKLNIGDKVIFRASAEEQQNALFELIDGASATVTEVDSPIYAPHIKFVEIKLDEPVELNGEMVKMVSGLDPDNIEKLDAISEFKLAKHKDKKSLKIKKTTDRRLISELNELAVYKFSDWELTKLF